MCSVVEAKSRAKKVSPQHRRMGVGLQAIHAALMCAACYVKLRGHCSQFSLRTKPKRRAVTEHCKIILLVKTQSLLNAPGIRNVCLDVGL